MSNLSKLIVDAAKASPNALFGTIENPITLADAVQKAAYLALHMDEQGYQAGARWAIIGHNSTEYMLTWMAAQFAGVELALLNPEYPDELLASMLDDLQPETLVWLDRESFDYSNTKAKAVDLRTWWDEQATEVDINAKINLRSLSGMKASSEAISAYIHTSGTTGRPKLCALSHDYFLRLGRFFADSMCLGKDDKIFAPLSMYHINPLGYGVIGALTAKTSILSTNKFSASQFWTQVKENEFSALVLHPSISIILATSSSPEEVKGHQVRVSFAAETLLCSLFNIPVGVCGFGSTESAGLSHSWHFRAGDRPMCSEGISNYAGRARHDVDWKIDDSNGEILVRNKSEGQAILSGYIREGAVQSALDNEGWFHTGDRGRKDEYGNLVFIERLSEAIRVKGEYVPIDFVESKLTRCRSLAPFALWRKENNTTGHTVMLYTESATVNLEEVYDAIQQLPLFMQPQHIVRIEQLPRVGANKVARNKLSDLPELDLIDL
jgi:carnitine-CoA ligase